MVERLGERKMPLLLHPDALLERKLVFPDGHEIRLPPPARRVLSHEGIEVIEERGPSYLSGVASNYLVTLEVTGRKSGRIVSPPLVMAVVDGQRYLVSMLGDDVQWVRNVRAAGGRAVLRSGGREEIQLEEVPADQRAPILRACLQRAPGARPHVPVNKDAALAEFEEIAAAFPVFRLVSNKPGQPARLHGPGG